MQVGIKKLVKEAFLPEYGTERSACADLYACIIPGGDRNHLNSTGEKYITSLLPDAVHMYPGDRLLVPTGLVFDIPDGYSLRVHPRSGLSFKKGLTVVCGEGVIDEDYQNELFIPIVNLSSSVHTIRHGDRVAQIELVKDERCTFGFVYSLSEKNSSRDGGFGHTGTR